jgi:hypothetical protein
MFFLRETSPMGAEPASERAGFIARMPVAQSSASKTPRVKLLQDGLAQDVEIAFGGPGALDHSHENDFVGDIAVATCKPKAHASHFERDSGNAIGPLPRLSQWELAADPER